MKKAILAVLVLTLGVLLMPKGASANAYGGVTLGTLDADIVRFSTLNVTAGLQPNEYFGVEARYGTGLGTDEYFDVDISLDSFYGGFATLSLPFDEVTTYIVVGKTWFDISAKEYGSAKDSDSSMGLGVKFDLREAFSLKGEYMQYADDVDSLSVTLQANF
jgi:outer membrane immunogenic protein